MKLPRLQRKAAPEIAEPASVGPAAPVLQVLIYSNTDLPEQEFKAQTEKLRRVASYDNATRSWYSQILFDRPEWAAEMLTALFDTARLHGTDIRVQTPPASEDSPSGQELCPVGTSASARGSGNSQCYLCVNGQQREVSLQVKPMLRPSVLLIICRSRVRAPPAPPAADPCARSARSVAVGQADGEYAQVVGAWRGADHG
jgi:hypothetical protein